jgi:hypothetical protein
LTDIVGHLLLVAVAHVDQVPVARGGIGGGRPNLDGRRRKWVAAVVVELANGVPVRVVEVDHVGAAEHAVAKGGNAAAERVGHERVQVKLGHGHVHVI